MSFFRIDGSGRKALPNKIAKKASTAMLPNGVAIATSGQVDVAVASSVLLLGITTTLVASTDSDYASATPVGLEQIDPCAVYLADLDAAAVVATLVANIGAQFDLKTYLTVDSTLGTTYKQVKLVGVIDTTHVLVTFNPNLL